MSVNDLNQPVNTVKPLIEKISNSEEIIAQIHLWIFEHCCKHGMRNVVKSIVQKYQVYDNIKKIIRTWRDDGISDETSPVNQDIMFIYLLERLKKSIIRLAEESKNHLEEPNFEFDFELLSLVVDLIENIYRRQDLMQFHTFACFISRLKLMELICRIAKQESPSDIMQRLHILFPPWNQEYIKYIMNKIGIPDMESLGKLSSSHKGIRRYILVLLSSEEKRTEYLKNSFNTDISDILQYSTKHLSAFSKYSEGKLPPTAIEQIMGGALSNTEMENDPAMRILLDQLGPDMTAKDFLSVLDSLAPELKVTPLKHCFDDFSDSDCEEVPVIHNENGVQPKTLLSFNEPDTGDLFLTRNSSPPKKRSRKPSSESIVSIPISEANGTSEPDLILCQPSCSKDYVNPITEPVVQNAVNTNLNSVPDKVPKKDIVTVKRRLYLKTNNDCNIGASTSASGDIPETVEFPTTRLQQKVSESEKVRMTRQNPLKNDANFGIKTPQTIKGKRTKPKPGPKSSKIIRRKDKGLRKQVTKCLSSKSNTRSPSSPFKTRTPRVVLKYRGVILCSDGSKTLLFT